MREIKQINLYKYKTMALKVSSAFFLVMAFMVYAGQGVSAAAIITVNSTADTVADDGVCTLREAITAANNDTASGATAGECVAGSGTDTINFAITGTADFTNGGQNGYTIQPTSELPYITGTTIINGYSQSGAQANTADAPNPFNGVLLIEIDGTNAGAGSTGLTLSANNIEVRGLVINSFDNDGIGVAADNIIVQGNYLGTDPAGLVDKGNNGMGIAQRADDSDNLLFGGLNAADRNLVSGNDSGGLSPNTDSDNWVVQGNYFGVAADGVTAIANAVSGGAGALSLDNSSGHLIGGPQPTAINIISGNNSSGIAPYNVSNVTIQGNYIGTDYTGVTALGNGGSGISFTDSTNSLIGGSGAGEGNIISNNSDNGVDMINTPSSSIVGNVIGNHNSGSGINVIQSVDVTVDGNTVEDSGQSNINIYQASNNAVITNNIVNRGSNEGITVYGSINAQVSSNTVSDVGTTGIRIADSSSNATVSDNTVNSPGLDGISVVNGSNGVTVSDNTVDQASSIGINFNSSDNAIISGNTIDQSHSSGVSLNGGNQVEVYQNNITSSGEAGLIVVNSQNITIGGTTAQGNTISDSSQAGIQLVGFGVVTSDVVIQGNTITGSGNIGIQLFAMVDNVLVGSTDSDRYNTVTNNAGAGIGLAEIEITAYSTTMSSNNISVLGNSIYNNIANGFAPGLGIDLVHLIDTSNPPDGNPETIEQAGVTANDNNDSDTGPNDYLNYPVISAITPKSDGTVDITFSLDVPDTAPAGVSGYLVQFYANDEVDPSGNGEGQYYLGSATVSGDVTNHTINITPPSSLDTTNAYAIAATTTEIDDSADGYGSTSEFSALVADVSLTYQQTSTNDNATTTNPGSQDTSTNNTTSNDLASTGVDAYLYAMLAIGLLLAGVVAGRMASRPDVN